MATSSLFKQSQSFLVAHSLARGQRMTCESFEVHLHANLARPPELVTCLASPRRIPVGIFGVQGLKLVHVGFVGGMDSCQQLVGGNVILAWSSHFGLPGFWFCFC